MKKRPLAQAQRSQASSDDLVMSVSVFSAQRLNGGFPCRKADCVAAEMLQYRSTTALGKPHRGDRRPSDDRTGEGFPMWAVA
jgi:hypothetical protein